MNQLCAFAKQINYLKDYEVDVPGAKYAKIDRLHLNGTMFKAIRKAPLQLSQGLPVPVAKSTSKGSGDTKIDKENQPEK